MTNEQIIITILATVLSSLANVFFEKIFGPYMPDRKKLSSYIKKFFNFTILYVIPIAIVLFLMIYPMKVDKFFVLIMAICFYNLSLSTLYRLFKSSSNLASRHVQTTKNQSDVLQDIAKVVGLLTKQVAKLESELHKK